MQYKEGWLAEQVETIYWVPTWADGCFMFSLDVKFMSEEDCRDWIRAHLLNTELLD